MVTALVDFRNKALQAGKPTEDIERLILMVEKKYFEKQSRDAIFSTVFLICGLCL